MCGVRGRAGLGWAGLGFGWAGLGWPGVCVSSHEGDDVCVYVASVAMSLQYYLHKAKF